MYPGGIGIEVAYGRFALELPSRHVLSPDSILNLFYF